MADFLRKNRAEVLKVSIYEYNEARHIQQEREAALEDGLQQGIQQGMERGIQRGALLEKITKIQKKAKKGLSAEDIADMLEEESEFVDEVMQIMKEYPDADVEEIYDLLDGTEVS